MNADFNGRGPYELQADRTPNGVTRPNTQLPEQVMNRWGQLPLGVTDGAVAAATELANFLPLQPVPEDGNAGSNQLSNSVH